MTIFQRLLNLPIIKRITHFSHQYNFFGIEGVSWNEIFQVYYQGLSKASLNNKAAAISWRLFLGMFPFSLFFLMLLQYMPHYEYIENYIYESFLANVLPSDIVNASQEYFTTRAKQIADNTKQNALNVLLISILTYLYFATNGTKSLIDGLTSKNLEPDKNRTVFKQYFVGIIFTIFFAVLMLSSLTLLYYTEIIWKLMSETDFLKKYDIKNLEMLKYPFFILILFIGISILYYKGPKNKLQYSEVLPGASLTTFLFLVVTYLFGLIVSNFGKFNVLYGSVGTIMILMLSIYFNVILILLGYELNIAIKKAKMD